MILMIKCIKSFADLIVEGNEYEVVNVKKGFYKVKNEKGVVNWYPKSIFVLEKEVIEEPEVEIVEEPTVEVEEEGEVYETVEDEDSEEVEDEDELESKTEKI